LIIASLRESGDELGKLTDMINEHKKEFFKNIKETKYMNADGTIKNPKPLKEKLEYVEREDDDELIQQMKQNDDDFMKAYISTLKEGDELINTEPFHDTSHHENNEDPSKEGLQGPGVYVLKNGKLVKGEGRKREEVMFSNWYCSNADPEDLQRHRELMDRFTFKGPKWDGVGVPKSVIEEENPVYRKRDKEEHPQDTKEGRESEGKKEFEYIVR